MSPLGSYLVRVTVLLPLAAALPLAIVLALRFGGPARRESVLAAVSLWGMLLLLVAGLTLAIAGAPSYGPGGEEAGRPLLTWLAAACGLASLLLLVSAARHRRRVR